VLQKLLIKRIMHHLYKTEFQNNQYGFTRQKSTTCSNGSETIHRTSIRGIVVIMASLDVRGAFDTAWWPAILKGLRDAKCPRKFYHLAQDCLKERKVVIIINIFSIQKTITKGCPQGSCCGPGFWNIQYIPLLNLKYTNHSK